MHYNLAHIRKSTIMEVLRMYTHMNFGGQRYLMENGNVILNYAKESGVFTKEQAYLMLPTKHYSTVDKVLKGMKVERCIFQKGERYFVVNPASQINYQMINCLWVLLDMKGDEVLKDSESSFWLTSPSKPAFLSYVKNTVLYDIVPVNRGEEVILQTLEVSYRNELEKYPESKHKYIIVVPNEDVLETMPELEIPHIFAIVNDIPFEEMDYEHKKVVNIEYYEG